MKVCNSCGAQVPDSSSSCPICGSVVAQQEARFVYEQSNTAGTPQPEVVRKKRKLPKIVMGVIVLLVVMFALSTCGEDSSASAEPWPTGPLAQMLPSMDRECASVFEMDDSLSIRVEDNVSKADYDDYVAKCKERGFVVDAQEASESYRAYNAEGYLLELAYHSFDKGQIDIDLEASKVSGALVWPTSGLATLLPDPGKSKGMVSSDSSDYFEAYVGEMSLEEYSAYVDACIELGFDVDYSKNDESYQASDASGNSLRVEYEGFQTMRVSIQAVESSSDSLNGGVVDDSQTTPDVSAQTDSEGIDPAFKEALDSYESFMDGYIQFMQAYNESTDTASLLTEYTKWMSDYADMACKIDAINQDDLNSEELAYYTEVTGRVSAKLAEAAVTV